MSERDESLEGVILKTRVESFRLKMPVQSREGWKNVIWEMLGRYSTLGWKVLVIIRFDKIYSVLRANDHQCVIWIYISFKGKPPPVCDLNIYGLIFKFLGGCWCDRTSWQQFFIRFHLYRPWQTFLSRRGATPWQNVLTMPLWWVIYCIKSLVKPTRPREIRQNYV